MEPPVSSLELLLKNIKPNAVWLLRDIAIMCVSNFVGMTSNLVVRVNAADYNSIRIFVSTRKRNCDLSPIS